MAHLTNSFNQCSESIVYGNDNLLLSLSKAFLVLSPKYEKQPNTNRKYKNVERCRGSTFKINPVNFEDNSDQMHFSNKFSFLELDDNSENCIFQNINMEELNQFKQNDISCISSFENRFSSCDNSNKNCYCVDYSSSNLQLSSLSFDVKISSTPKPVRIKNNTKNYIKSEKSKLFLKKKFIDFKNECKKRKLINPSKIEKKKNLKKHEVNTSTKILDCNGYFKNFLQKKTIKKSKNNDDASSSSRKYQKRRITTSSTIYEKKTEININKKSKEYKENNSQDIFQIYNSIITKQEIDKFNLFNQNSFFNNFNQFGQLKVWYL